MLSSVTPSSAWGPGFGVGKAFCDACSALKGAHTLCLRAFVLAAASAFCLFPASIILLFVTGNGLWWSYIPPPTPPCPVPEPGTQEEPGWRLLPCFAQHMPPGGLGPGSQWWAGAEEAHGLGNWRSIPKSLIILPVFSSVHLRAWEWKHCNFQKGYEQNGKMPKDVLCKGFLPGYQKGKEEFSSHFLFTSILSVWQEVTTQICSLKDWLQCLVKKI